MMRTSGTLLLTTLLASAMCGWGCGADGDDDFINPGDDDDHSSPFSVSGTMIQPLDVFPQIEAGASLEVRLYSDEQWDENQYMPVDLADYTAGVGIAAAGTWPMTYTIALTDGGSLNLFAFADVDGNGLLSGEFYGVGPENPLAISAALDHITGQEIVFDQFAEGPVGDDDDDTAAGDDDSAAGDDDSAD